MTSYIYVIIVAIFFTILTYTSVSMPSLKLTKVYVGFEVLTAVVVKSYIFWDVKPCSMTDCTALYPRGWNSPTKAFIYYTSFPTILSEPHLGQTIF
jgi:hypothetical protein